MRRMRCVCDFQFPLPFSLAYNYPSPRLLADFAHGVMSNDLSEGMNDEYGDYIFSFFVFSRITRRIVVVS